MVFLHNGCICHCTICQRNTGQPAEIAVMVKAGTLRYQQNEPKYLAASDFGKRGCGGLCGARNVRQVLRPADDWLTNVTVGTLDRPSDARATGHINADTQLYWYHVCEDPPKFTEQDAARLITILKQGLNPGA